MTPSEKSYREIAMAGHWTAAAVLRAIQKLISAELNASATVLGIHILIEEWKAEGECR